MKNITLQSLALFFLSIYFLIAFYPLRLDFSNTYIPVGQIIPLLMVFIISLIHTKGIYRQSKNIDSRLVAGLAIYIFINAFIQAMFDTTLIEYRMKSILAAIIPIFFFYGVMFLDIKDEQFKTISRCFFFGCFIFAVYYFESFASARFMEGHDSQTRAIGQRDSILLNFVLLVAIFRNYHSNYFEKILGIVMVVFILTIFLYSQIRMGYVLLMVNLVVFAFLSKKYFFFVFLPFLVAMTLLWIYYFSSVGDVHSLMSANNTNQFDYSIARFKTMTDSIMSIFSSNYSLDGSTLIRVKTWTVILDEALSSPISFLFGSGELGVHSLNKSFLVYNTDWEWNSLVYSIKTAESQYFDTIFRRGFIGLIFMFAILFRVIYLSFYLMRFDKKFYDIYIVFFIGFIGLGFTFFMLPLLRDRTFVIFFFVAYAVLSSRAYIISKLQRLNR